MEIKQAIITGFMGKLKDRFCEYHEAKTPEEKIAAVAKVSPKGEKDGNQTGHHHRIYGKIEGPLL